ncbi:cAMP-regulated phosphoprotein 19-like [Hydractinia symbiolongicarpus]|uniref:cAMP-regulated phosphoprotein 19-like n=1 Tax=Hydractinia symbiolongicarpus TaxID=13093 RepID=UPI002549E736|nr:cAMP-regulated phosphoprotein 19-like [Hydractinia symbiolongicarpus]XP_057305902.1 cAMP-regulated phosphoprotein 19-like [Hydractinia symbiolongicarpus]
MATFKAPQEISEADRFKQKFPGHGVPKQSDFLRKRLQGKGGAKYFDSGDYNVAKSTKKKDATIVIGKAIPTPDNLPQRKPSCSKQSSLLEGDTPHPHPSDEKETPTVDSDEQKSNQVVMDE